jgi:damage-control phosphatase, subfamily III
VFELSTRFVEPFSHTSNLSEEQQLEKERLMFLELTQGQYRLFRHGVFNTYILSVCLWGNSTDLSLLINMTEEQIKSLQSTGGDHLAATEKKYEWTFITIYTDQLTTYSRH